MRAVVSAVLLRDGKQRKTSLGMNQTSLDRFARGIICALAALCAAGATRAEEKEEKLPVLVYARKTDAKVAKTHPRPTPEAPAYYFPIAGGYTERGPSVAGENPVGLHEVWPSLEKALAKQGYLPTGRDLPPPTLILTFHWGSMNPDVMDNEMDLGDGETISNQTILNFREMLALTGGHESMQSMLHFERDEATERASEDRYFVIVTAFDFAAALEKPRRKVMVWQTCLSVPSLRTSLAAAIGPMITAGAASFGRDERTPKEIETPYRRGRVDIGEMQVIDHPTEVQTPKKKR